jgi:hypothetical protein
VCLAVPPTTSPTTVPTTSPTERPTKAPTRFPTKAPSAPTCVGGTTSAWIYNPTTNLPVRKLGNNTVTCLRHPYIIGVRTCNSTTVPARVRLATGSGRVIHQSYAQSSSPLFLFGPAATPEDVLPSPQALPDGTYVVSVQGAPELGRLTFAQACRCTRSKKGGKGCRNAA